MNNAVKGFVSGGLVAVLLAGLAGSAIAGTTSMNEQAIHPQQGAPLVIAQGPLDLAEAGSSSPQVVYIEKPHHSNPAKAPAITLGVLSALGGVIQIGAGANSTNGGLFIAFGIINTALGIWGIWGGASAD